MQDVGRRRQGKGKIIYSKKTFGKSGGLVPGWQSGGHGLDDGRVVRQAGVWNRESDHACGGLGEG